MKHLLSITLGLVLMGFTVQGWSQSPVTIDNSVMSCPLQYQIFVFDQSQGCGAERLLCSGFVAGFGSATCILPPGYSVSRVRVNNGVNFCEVGDFCLGIPCCSHLNGPCGDWALREIVPDALYTINANSTC